MNEPNHSSSPAANWTKIIEQCNNNRPAVTPSQEQRPVVTFAEIPLPNQQNSMTDTFKADTVIHTRTMVIGISNTISDTLLSRLLEATHHAH